MSDELQQLRAAIDALQARRAVIGDAVVSAALGPLQARLSALEADRPGAESKQVLKQVSILFLDVVGSTALTQRLDPEEVSEVMNRALQRGTAIVNAHQGRVLQYAGDSVLAAFGTQDAAEDDAERAVHCGLALLALGREMAAEVLAARGHAGMDVRVGIHTGRVLLGGGVEDEGTIRGLPVNLAARMEQTAPPGTLRISHETWLHVRGVFDMQPQPPMVVKGYDKPVVSYLVQRAKARAFRLPRRGIDGLQLPMVGRSPELALLTAMVDDVATQRQPRVATMIGEPGLGKTRLLHELQATLETHAHRFWLLLGRAHPSSHLQPYSLLRDLLSWRLQIGDGDSSEQAKAKLVEGLLPVLGGQGAEAKAHRLGQIIGLDFSASPHIRGLEPGVLRALALDALQDCLRGMATLEGAVALLLEDLHWADDASLDFVERVMALQDGAVLVVASARPELLERRPAWGHGQSQHQRIALQPLDAVQADALANALLIRLADDNTARESAESLHALLVARAQGNPFYMEELVRMLLDDGVIAADGEAWRVLPERLNLARVPTTLVGVLQARLDSLPAAERLALQQASIVGPVFWDQALAGVDPKAPESLPALQARSLVHLREHSSFEGTREEAFHHHLLQQVTYDTVLKPMRRAGHTAVAKWLAQRVGDRHAEFLAITAEHHERAGDSAQALRYFERAAIDAQNRYANAAALDCAERALCSPAATDPRQRERLYRLQQEVADLTGQRTVQEAALAQREAIAETLDDDTLRADLLYARAQLASRRSDERAALDLARRAAQAAARSGNLELEAMAVGQVAWCHYSQGELTEADDLVQRAIALAQASRRAQDTTARQHLLVKLMMMRAIVLEAAMAVADAHALLIDARQLARGLESLRLQVGIQQLMGNLALAGADHLQAVADHLHAARLAEQIGYVDVSATSHFNAASALFELGRGPEVAALLDTAEAAARRCEARVIEGRSLLLRGRLAALDGDEVAAMQALGRAHEMFETIAAAPFRCQARAHTALLHLQCQRLPQALAMAELVAADLQTGLSLDSTDNPLLPHLACHRIWLAAGDTRAAAALAAAHTALQKRAARISDPEWRQRVLNNVAVHREVAEAWAAQQARGSPADTAAQT